MKNNDATLIQNVLDGDDTAFTMLVQKHHKSVHALAWRKIGDFHIAEEITQDTFLKAYQKLSTLKEPQRFLSWLYVIATNLCKAWHRKKHMRTQLLDKVSNSELEKATYSNYVIGQNKQDLAETQRDVVKKLLAKLPESDRTVITLYYLAEMSYQEISNFLGVSEAAIRNRLYRARHRLKKEETMIREALEHFQISPNLTDNIMQAMTRLKPTPSSSKPFIPWTITASTVVLIALILGIGNQNLARFQKPYSLEAQSEMTVELVEAPIVQEIKAQPDVRRQFGNTNAVGNNNSPRQNTDELLFAAAVVEGENTTTTNQQWIQGNAPTYKHGPSVRSLYSTPEGDVYIFINNGKFAKLPANGTEWEVVSDVSTLHDVRNRVNEIPITVFNNTFYTVLSDKLFSSIDKGKTWQSVGKRPQGNILGLVEIDNVFYLAMQDEIFRSTDIGKTWVAVKDGLPGEIRAIKAIQNTLFVSTRIDESQKLYRRNDDSWEHLQFPHAEIDIVTSFAGTKDILYVMVALDFRKIDGQNQGWWIFRSVDKGDSWTDVTPKNAWNINDDPPSLTIAAVGNTVLAIGTKDGAVVRSIDRGNSWILKEITGIPVRRSYIVSKAVALDESTFYTFDNSEFLRSLDGGQSWNRVKIGEESRIDNLIWIKPDRKQNASADLYCMVLSEVYKSRDRGKSWQVVNPKINIREYNTDEPPVFTRINRSSDMLYTKYGGNSVTNIKTGIFRLSVDGNTFVPIQGMPHLDSQRLQQLLTERVNAPPDYPTHLFEKKIKKEFIGAAQFFKTLANWDVDEENGITKRELYSRYINVILLGSRGRFAVSDDTFYMEYNYKLFRWRPGESEWYDTGVEETGELNRRKLVKSLELAGMPQEEISEILRLGGFKLAVSGNTIYVGKRDGKLVGSFDEGNNWIDFTPALPFPVTYFKEIVFAGNTVYVATDAGVAATNNGKNWHAVTDASGTQVKIDKLAADGNSLYGYSKKTGIYRLENGNWHQIFSETLPYVNSLAVNENTLYVGTMEQGMFTYNLE